MGTKPADVNERLLEQHTDDEDASEDVTEPEDALMSVIGALVATMSSFMLGYTLGYTSPAQVDLMATKSQPCSQASVGLCLSVAQFAAFSGTVNVAALLGTLASAPVTDAFGRRSALQASAIPLATGWFVQSISDTFIQLMAGRVLTGIGIGASSPIVPLYIAEIAPRRFRGSVGALHQLMITLGTLVVFILGNDNFHLHWNIIALLGAFPPLIMLLVLFLFPESPHWLMGSDASEGSARRSLMFYRRSAKVDKELGSIKRDVMPAPGQTLLSSKPSLPDIFSRSSRPGMIVSCATLGFMQSCGVSPLLFFSHRFALLFQC